MTAVHPTVLQAAGMRSSDPIARRRGHLRHRHHNREAIPRRREDLQARLRRRVPLRHPAILPRQATLRGEAVRTALVVRTAEEVAAAIRVVLHTGAAEGATRNLDCLRARFNALSSLLSREMPSSRNSVRMIGFMSVDANLIR
jgi:hypothetical protein